MLTVHRAERADRLVEALGAVLTTPLDDPFAPELVAVPSRGIERWLTQQLSNVLGTSGSGRGDGVCANVQFPFPGRLVGIAMQAATSIDPAADPWSPGRAVWPLLWVIDEHLGEAWMATLSEHVGGGGDDEALRARRFGTARHLADLYDRYAVHRPAMIESWAAGQDVDGRGEALPPEVVWQAKLWRLVRARIDVASPAERLGPACERLRGDPNLVELPARVSLFGLTRLAPSLLQVLDAVATARDVHLFLLHPSHALWERVAAEQASNAAAQATLLSTWGKDAREMQLAIVATLGDHDVLHHAVELRTHTLLERLQADVRADVPPPGAPIVGGTDERMVIDAGDDSVQVHSCHGRARQVEVVRDAILHLLNADPTLEPRDVIVMCPDIETFAPLIHATFGSVETLDGASRAGAMPELHVRLADRSLRQVNPILAAVSDLLELVPARVTASQLVDFAGSEPVRRRFHLDDDDIGRLEEWVAASGVRWGLDGEHRRPFQLFRLDANTWRSGLDRILLGVSMSEDERRLVGGVLPLDDVDSGDIELVGRLAELVERTHAAVTRLSGRRTVNAWAEAISDSADELMACSAREAWQRGELDRLLRDVVEEASCGPASAPELAIQEIRSLLGDRLRGRASRANFRTGHLTVCTLVPMRSVPHRVVCLLGLDDGAFPRHGAPDGDDILLRTPQVGDHDVRTEDRQLLLDALLASTEHLVVTYAGRDERTNAPLPPSVPIGELLDVIDATARTATGPARSHVVVGHPLQPFDPRNFDPGQLIANRSWSFDPTALDGARALGAARSPRPAFLTAPLPPIDVSLVELDDLARFVQHPTKGFLRRLGIRLENDDDELDDAIPVELDALQRWGVGDRLLKARLEGADWASAIAAEQSRGLLSPDRLGEQVITAIRPAIDDIVTMAQREMAGESSRAVDVRVDIGAGRVLSGTVPGVYGPALVTVAFSRVGPKHRIATWVRLLALAAGDPSREYRAVTVGQRRSGLGVGAARIPAVDPDRAAEHVRTLVDLYERGTREPIPVYCKTSEALARRRAARSEWDTDRPEYQHEDLEPEHVLVLGGQVPFASLLEARPRPDESGPAWDATATTRVERYARRLWAPLLDIEERHAL